MKSLDKKLLRDLWHMKGQAFAIALVIMSGVSTFVMFRATMDSLYLTRDRFYDEHGFADVFAPLKRAPESLAERIRQAPGVGLVETRVAADVKLDIAGFGEPVTARLVSLPDHGRPLLNRLYLRQGRLPEPGRDSEVVVSEAFAQAHRFAPGSSFGAVINGRWKTLTVTGIVLSPEFVLQVRPGAISPDFKRYGILWMGRKALGTAYDMEGAFNEVSLTLAPGGRAEDVIRRLDDILDRFGGFGAYARKDQMSHRFLSEEFRQLQQSARLYPAIFIGVAAFLLNVVITRTVSTQREQIAALKAFGYTTTDVAVHFVKLVLLVVLIGTMCGTLLGIRLGRGLGNIYMEFYRFPFFLFVLRPAVVALAAGITGGAAVLGTVHSVWQAVRISPAQAMRPEQPARYRTTAVERVIPARLLSQPTRIILRNLERRPVKALLSVIGIALACAIMIIGGFFEDTVNYMVDIQFRMCHREDMTVTFVEATSRRSVYELKGLAGVQRVEPFRSVPVRFRNGNRTYRTAIRGVADDSHLYRLLDRDLRAVPVPKEGVVLTDYLGTMLGVGPGDTVTAEVLEGSRPVRRVPVAGLVREYIGLMGYMDLDALNRMLREGRAVSGVSLTVDARHQDALYRTLVEMPRVAGAVVRRDEIRNFYDTQAEAMLFFTFVATVLAGIIAFGVVYNSARISLAERSRELASLRVLGYTRGEISYILLGELAILTLAALPVGFVLGRWLCTYVAVALSSDLFRIPAVTLPATYSLAAAVVLVSAAFSSLIVRHRLDHLDLVAVLKTRE
ncbi:MAG: ABC transporter permease [Nitrospirae bacterium]|nr:ABC transporter permease [Nitrospirota bacterium]NTW67046.1 ABC transporter permease [Nitrospirota bacterium]